MFFLCKTLVAKLGEIYIWVGKASLFSYLDDFSECRLEKDKHHSRRLRLNLWKKWKSVSIFAWDCFL